MKFFPHGFSTLHCGVDDGSAAPLRPPKDWAGWGSWVEHSVSGGGRRGISWGLVAKQSCGNMRGQSLYFPSLCIFQSEVILL